MPKHVRVAIAMTALVLGAGVSATDTETADAALAEPLTVVLLPVRAHVMKFGIKLQPAEEWTAAAGAAVDAAVREVVGPSTQFRVRELPGLTADEQSAIDELLAVATLVQLQEHDVGRRNVSRVLRAHIDRSLGTSLAFLHERAGADYALVTLGTQAEQGKDRVALDAAGVVASVLLPPLLFLPSTSFSHLATFLVDLRTGQVRWFNGRSGYEIGGYNFTDLRDPASAHKVISELLQPYPETPPKLAKDTRPTPPPGGLSTERVTPRAGGFAFHPPASWRLDMDPRKSLVTATRDGLLLNEIKVQLRSHRDAFPDSKQRTTRHSSLEQLAQWYAAELQVQEREDLQISETSLDAQLAGRAAFRVRYSERLPVIWGGARIEHVVIGTVVPGGLLLAEFTAPRLGFFANLLTAFEESTPTIVLESRKSPR